MSPRSDRTTQHVFVSPDGEALPRWLQAFSAATVTRLASLARVAETSTIVWMRLDPAGRALEQLAALRKSVGAARVIVLANRPDNEEALALFSGGVRGYCNAHATVANLRQVARVVQEGGLWIGEALMQRLLVATQAAILSRPVGETAPGPAVGPAVVPLSTLTAREQEVARAIANGLSNKEIARQMGITERTIKAHASSIFRKLKARDRLHLALIVSGSRPA